MLENYDEMEEPQKSTQNCVGYFWNVEFNFDFNDFFPEIIFLEKIQILALYPMETPKNLNYLAKERS